MDKVKILEGVTLLLEGIGQDVTNASLKLTPQRVTDFYSELFSEVPADPRKLLRIYPSSTPEMILIKDIQFYSLCQHHLLPFFGKADIAYLPQGNKVASFSGVARLVETLSRGLRIQENLTVRIADSIQNRLKPKGVLVRLEAEHLCLSMRGVKKPGTLTVTLAKRGVFRRPERCLEVLALLRRD